MNTSADATPNASGTPTAGAFLSITAMRDLHGELLKRRREAGLGSTASSQQRTDSAAEQLVRKIAAFVERGRQTGALLDNEDERAAAQSLLTYWANILQRLGHELDDAALAEFDPLLAPELPDAACPYLGLDAFREADSGRFFGREPMVRELLERLGDERMLFVVGPSGSGKSSLVRAGLVPALRGGALPGSEGWLYLEPLVPGGEPLAALARVLAPAANRQHMLQVAQILRDRPAAAVEILKTTARALLIVDQFEELFTLVESEAERLAFVEALLALAADAPGHRVVLTMRSDFEPFVAAIAPLYARFAAGRVAMVPLGAVELRQAIEAPAQAIGLKFEPGVVDLLVQDIVGEPAGLPLLQFTLLKLWEARERNRITLAAYERVGGGRQALARSADAFYDELIPEEQVTVRRLLLRMVRPGDGLEVTSSRVRLDTLYALGEDPGRVERVLQKLVDVRLLRQTPGDAQSAPQVEVAHEALVRNWPRLVGWLEDEKQAIAARRRLEQRAQEWRRLGGGRAGLLDETQLHEAERWVASPEAVYLGYDPAVSGLVFASREALREAAQEREAARHRELEQTRALAAEQQARAEAQAARAEAERRSRNVARVLSALLALAAIGALALFVRAQGLAASEARLRVEAQSSAATANALAGANASLAATSELLRQTAEARSEAEQQLRATAVAAQQAEADRAGELAVALRQARAGELAAQAQGALASLPQRSLLLAVAGVGATDTPEQVALDTLYTAVAHTNGESIANHDSPIAAASTTADGGLLATGGEEGIRLWALEASDGTASRVAELAEPARFVALSPDGRWLVAAGDGRVLLYALSGGSPGLPETLAEDTAVTTLAISPDGPGGPWLIVADEDGVLRGWPLGGATRGQAVTLSGSGRARPDGAVTELAFTPDGGLLLSGGADRVVRLWNLGPTSQLSRFVASLNPRDSAISALAISADGTWMAAGAGDGSIHLWRLNPEGFSAGPAVKTGHQGAITTLAFSPDGAWLLSGSTDRNARLWAESGFSATGADAVVLTGHSQPIVAAIFSPDSQYVVTGGADRALLVWRLAEPSAEALRLHGHDGAVTAIFVAGGRLLSAGADGQQRRWPLPPERADARAAAVAALPLAEVRALACTIAGRTLTPDEVTRFFGDEPEQTLPCGE